MSDVELILDIKNTLGEGPHWCVQEQALYWVDILEDCFYRYDPATGDQERYDIGQAVGTVVRRESGGFVLALRNGLAFYDDEYGLRPIVDPESERPETRFNDGKCDRSGRFWAGTMADGSSPVGSLYRLDTDLTLHRMVTGVSVSNGLGWSPDNRIMYYTDTPTHKIYMYDYDAATGDIENRRVFAEIPDGEGGPDGLTVDSEGGVWSARWDGWKITRYDLDGKVEREVKVPAARVTSCVFGGPDLDELYITTARVGFDAAQLADQPAAGGIFRLKAGVKGMPEPQFGG